MTKSQQSSDREKPPSGKLLRSLFRPKNADLSVPIFAAVICAVLSAIGVIKAEVGVAALLGVAGVVLLGIVGLRMQLTELSLKSKDNSFNMGFPRELDELLEDVDQNILLIGPSLNRTLMRHANALSSYRGIVRIVLTDPGDEVSLDAIARRRRVRDTREDVKNDVASGIAVAKQIRAGGRPGGVEVRVIDQPLPSGFVLLESTGRVERSRLFWEIYQIKGNTGIQPCIWLTPESKVFGALAAEARSIWEMARPVA